MAKAKKKEEVGTGTPIIHVPQFNTPHRLSKTLFSAVDVRDRVYALEDYVRDLGTTVELQQAQIMKLTELLMTQITVTKGLAGK